MSQEVTTAMVDQFSSNVMHLAQQKESRLWMHCRQESQEAESKFYDRIGPRSMRRRAGRHADVVYDDTPHSRRMVTLDDFESADLVDEEDKLRTIMNLENEYAQAHGQALGRQIDTQIIDFALSSAYGGKKGTTAVALPNAQKVAAFVATETTGSALNIPTLRAVRKKFKQNEVIGSGENLVFALAAQQTDDLLASTDVTSQDFNSVKALVDGDVKSFMGFDFVSLELLPFNAAAITYSDTDGSVGAGGGTIALGAGRRCFAFKSKSSILCAVPKRMNAKIDVLPQKSHATQVLSKLIIGGTRMEEVQVVEVICKEV